MAKSTALARDTVFAAVMIILNGIVGMCLPAGGSRHGEQRFGRYGVNASLAALAAIVVLTLVLPNYTTSVVGPVYGPSQLGFVGIVSLATGWTLTLGIDAKSTVLLGPSLLVATLSLGTGRTTVLQGAVHLVIFAVYLFATVVP